MPMDDILDPSDSLWLSALRSLISSVFVSCRRSSSVRPASGTNGHEGLGASTGRGGATETGDPNVLSLMFSLSRASTKILLHLQPD